MHYPPTICFLQGECITSISPDDVCALSSVTTECDDLVATRCECRQGYQTTGALTCEGNNIR